jgi:5'-phosphate synthase pdxT subunit
VVTPTIGVLALQGAFARHIAVLGGLGHEAVEVRRPDELAAVDALFLPGGESTTMSMLLESSGLFEPLAARLAADLPVFGTCAGMILLAAHIADGRADQRCFGAIDIDVRRNGYGRQVDSFDEPVAVVGLDDPFPASFIRAPVVERTGAGVAVLARVDSSPVLCTQGAVFVASFHPELSDDDRLHQLFLDTIQE